MEPNPGPTLSPQQKSVMFFISEGYIYSEIASLMEISEQAVKQYAVLARDKLGARTMPQAMVIAVRQGLLNAVDYIPG